MLRLAYWVSFSNNRDAKIKVSKVFFSYKHNYFDGEMIIYRNNQLVGKSKEKDYAASNPPPTPSQLQRGVREEQRREAGKK